MAEILLSQSKFLFTQHASENQNSSPNLTAENDYLKRQVDILRKHIEEANKQLKSVESNFNASCLERDQAYKERDQALCDFESLMSEVNNKHGCEKEELEKMSQQVDHYERQMMMMKTRLESREEEFALANSREQEVFG